MSLALSELLKLPAGERAELAMALWESLSEAEREAGIDLTSDEAADWTVAGRTTFSARSPRSRGMTSDGS